jgi:signal transduction histidine kinase
VAVNDTEKINILLVDDQPAKLLSYELILAELGENLLKAGSASEALEQLLKYDVAVVLVDVCMPDLDGFELATMIRQHPRFEKTAIIFVSAIQVNELDLLKGYAAGGVDYVPVPVVPDLLRAKVRVFVDLYRKTWLLERLNTELERRVEERTAELAMANAELERRVEQRTREREAALAQVHEMQKLESLGQLTGGVAHDFNNLLMAILSNLDLLKRRQTDDPKAQWLIDGAIQGAERGASLTKRMLAFARRQELKPAIVNIANLVESMTEMLRRSLGPGVQITTSFPERLSRIKIDPNQFELAILNLALNARDAMPLGGLLRMTSSDEIVGPGDRSGLAPGPYVKLSVSDTGSGMDEATLKRATEPFFTTKGVGKGTGLGLSMVHGLAAQSGGLMRLSSIPGKGTTVELWLPAAVGDEAEDGRPVAGLSIAGVRPCRVLVVDDDPIIAASTGALLEDLGHTVLEATSGIAALELLRSDPEIDFVITDHAMPGMRGTELAVHIRKLRPNMPILLASGYAELPNGEDPGLPRLAKPYRREELVAAIGDLFGASTSGNVVSIGAARRAQ